MTLKAYTYLRTSKDDGKEKAGLPVQREKCAALALSKGFEIVTEFADDGVSGKIPMSSRPAGKQLIAALLADGVKTVICYDSKRIGRTQQAYWSFAGICRENQFALIDADGTDLLGTITGGFNAMMAEDDRNRTIERLAAGKKIARAEGKRVEGRWPYGDSPYVEHNAEREVVKRICKMSADGLGSRRIAAMLNKDGVRTRYGKEFKSQTIDNILHRRMENVTDAKP